MSIKLIDPGDCAEYCHDQAAAYEEMEANLPSLEVTVPLILHRDTLFDFKEVAYRGHRYFIGGTAYIGCKAHKCESCIWSLSPEEILLLKEA